MASTETSSLKRLFLAVLALGYCSASRVAPVEAQDEPVDGFLPAPDQAGYLGFPSTRTPGHLGVDANLWLDYGLHTLEGESLGIGKRDPIRHRLDATAIVQLGLWSRGALALRMPMVLIQRGDDIPGAPKLASVAAGNPAIDGRVRLLGAPVREDGSVNDGGALALRGVVHLPVGTDDAYFADGATRFEVGAIGDIEMFGIGAGAELAYRHRFDDSTLRGAPPTNELRLLGALRLPLPLLARAFPGKVQESVVVELDVGTDATDFFASRLTPVEGRLAYRTIFGDYFATLGVGAGFRSAIGSPDMRLLAAFGWSPRTHDQDGDGVPDGQDQCEHLPEDRDGFQDNDGCADDDNDGDLIVDEDDRCPMEAAEMGRDDDEDGCTDR